jgi:hypothetical protein
MNGGKGMHIGYWWEARRKETTIKTKKEVVDNIKMDPGEIGLNCMNWIDRDHCWALVNMGLNLEVS